VKSLVMAFKVTGISLSSVCSMPVALLYSTLITLSLGHFSSVIPWWVTMHWFSTDAVLTRHFCGGLCLWQLNDRMAVGARNVHVQWPCTWLAVAMGLLGNGSLMRHHYVYMNLIRVAV